jgi:thiol-disulfide isomerase/thioredoxin
VRGLAVLVALAALVLTGCSDDGGTDFPTPGRPTVDVDTPDLRELKEEAGVEPCPAADGDPVDGGLPDVTLPCLGGGPDVALGALRGPMVVNLWASWCGPCRQEMPVLQAFHEQHGAQVPVLGIDWQDPQVTGALQLVVDTGVTYPLVADVAGDLGAIDGMPVRGLPGIVLLDAEGEVVFRELQEIESQEELEDLVAEHLGVEL